jgi:hypothetical protein
MPSEATPAERQLVSPPGSRNVLIRRRSNYRSAMSITGPVDNDHVHALLARLKANFDLDSRRAGTTASRQSSSRRKAPATAYRSPAA